MMTKVEVLLLMINFIHVFPLLLFSPLSFWSARNKIARFRLYETKLRDPKATVSFCFVFFCYMPPKGVMRLDESHANPDHDTGV
jgi:hypothetical protein